MGRRIGENVRNELNIQDPVSGSVITLYYRLPTSEERVAYLSAQFEREGKTIRLRIPETRQDFGFRILTGFKEGCFEKPAEKSGSFTPVSWDPRSPNYDREWKDLVRTYASDLIELLAAHVFEGQRVIPPSANGAGEYSEKNS